MKYASDFRKSARDALANRWGIAIVAGLIMSVVGTGTQKISSFGSVIGDLIGNFIKDKDIFDKNESIFNDSWLEEFYNGFIVALETMLPFIVGFIAVASLFALAISAAQFIAGSIMGVGWAKFNLDHIDGEKVSLITIFKAFKDFARPVIASLWILLFVSIGLFLFVIPGIIISYNYAMVPYILAEDKDISARDALRLSKKIMYGNRWRLFCLEISFIGWDLLSILTFGLLSIWITPYKAMAQADFYREISGTRRIAAEFSVE